MGEFPEPKDKWIIGEDGKSSNLWFRYSSLQGIRDEKDKRKEVKKKNDNLRNTFGGFLWVFGCWGSGTKRKWIVGENGSNLWVRYSSLQSMRKVKDKIKEKENEIKRMTTCAILWVLECWISQTQRK